MLTLQSRLINIILVLTLAVILPCCGSKDDEPASYIPSNAVYDFATLVESSSAGSVLELQKSNDSPVITYSSSVDLANASTHVDIGDRVIICYTRVDGEVYTSGQIKLYAYATLGNTEKSVITGTLAKYDDWATPPFDISAIWRSGSYINIQAKLYGLQSISPETYILVADEATLADEYPVLHLMYTNKKGNNGQNRYPVNASFNIADVWDLSSCHGVRIDYLTTGGLKSVTFDK